MVSRGAIPPCCICRTTLFSFNGNSLDSRALQQATLAAVLIFPASATRFPALRGARRTLRYSDLCLLPQFLCPAENQPAFPALFSAPPSEP
jgi:hypothetical protein